MNIPLSKPGSLIDFDALLAPGVHGYAMEDAEGRLYIPVIEAVTEGNGDVGRFLDALPKDRTVRFPTVMSARLAGMLERRGFTLISEDDHELGRIDIYERQP